MRFPYLASWDKTPVTVTISSDGIDENGVPEVLGVYEGLCSFSNKTTTTIDNDGRQVNISGVVTIKGDIFPSKPLISGTVNIHGRDVLIYTGHKILNPDGSVNHTRLELL